VSSPARRPALLAALMLLTLGSASAAPAKHPVTPRTLVSSHNVIYALAQDGDTLGWVAADARVRIRRVSAGRTWVVGKVDPPERAGGATIAVAGTRALWAWDNGGNNAETAIVTGAPGRKAVGIEGLQGGFRGFGDGERFSGLAGDGMTLAFGWATEACSDQPHGICDLCDPLGSCPLYVVGGAVALVPVQASRQRPPAIPSVTPPALFDVGQGRVAVVPARSPTPEGEWVPRVAEDGPVEVFDLAGRLLMRVRLPGFARGVALFGHKLALLQERPDGSKVILRYDARNGTYLGGSGLLSLGTTDLSAATGGIVFRDGRRIYLLRGRTPTLLAEAAHTPIGLSIEGRRIAWAENGHGHGRILALTAPQ
jgi:hypothetical protein